MQRTHPPFRADHVGSLLRTAPLKQARAGAARGEVSAEQLKAVENREIERVIKKQEEAGLQSITDGEFRRSWWHLDFLWGLDGVEKHAMDAGVAFAGVTTRNEGLKVTAKIGFSGHPMIEHFKFVKEHTKHTSKITIPAPSALYGRPALPPIDRQVYPKLDQMFDDLGQAYKKAVRAFADAGCRYLQLDEVFIAMLCDANYRQKMKDRGDDPEKLGALYGDLINTAMSDIPSDMTITVHLCAATINRPSWVPAATRPSRRSCSTASKCTVTSWNTTPSAPADSSRSNWCRRTARSCSAWSPPRPDDWKAGTRSSAALREPRNIFRSTSSACRRNAASPRPRKAISWPKTSNGRSSAWWWNWPMRCGGPYDCHRRA
jgi:methionine synthase II (cobalamin-independent)